MRRQSIIGAMLLLAAFTNGCLSVRTHSTVDPIYMTLDVNLKVQLQRELTDAFGAIDAASETMDPPAASSEPNS